MAAVITQGTTVTINAITLDGVTDITPPSVTRSLIDITNIYSPNHAKQYAAGMIDSGEMSVTVILGVGVGVGIGTITSYIDDYTGVIPCTITLADSSSITFYGLVTKVQIDGIATGDNAVKATIGIKPVGEAIYTFA